MMRNRILLSLLALASCVYGQGTLPPVTDRAVITIPQTGHGFAVKDIIRHNGSTYVKAQADSVANAEVAGMVIAVPNSNQFTLLMYGNGTGLTGLTPGTTYFLSPTSPGALTTTSPSTVGQVSKPLLIATSSTGGYFYNWRGIVNAAPAGGGSVTSFSAGNLTPLFTTSVATATTTPALTFALSSAGAQTVFGNNTASSAAPAFSSAPQFLKIGNLTSDGFVKTSGGDGTLSVDTGTYLTGNQTITLSGNVTGSGTTAITTTIPASTITYAKMQNVSANSKLLGSSATGSGAPPSEITLGTNLSMSGSTLNATGGGGTPGGSSTQVQFNDSGAFGGDVDLTWDKTANALGLASGAQVNWSTDTGLARNAAGVIEINNGTAGSFQDLRARQLDLGSSGSARGYVLFREKDNAGFPGFNISASDGTTLRASMQYAGSATAVGWLTGNLFYAKRLNNSGLSFFGNLDAGLVGVGLFSYDSGGVLIGKSDVLGDPGLGNLAVTGNAKIKSNGSFLWSNSSTNPTASTDTGLSRNAAGVVEVNNGTAGTYRDLKLSTLNATTGLQVNGAAPSGYSLRGNATNFVSYPLQLSNSNTSDNTGFAADQYIAGSSVVVAAGDFKAKGQYRCTFDMAKTTTGTAAPTIDVRIGTLGTTGDTSRMTFTFGAGTGVADTGTFDVLINFRSVGSGTSAVISGVCRASHNLATTGLFSNAAAWTIVGTTSGGFDSSAATTIGLSFNGGSSFSGTNKVVQAILQQ